MLVIIVVIYRVIKLDEPRIFDKKSTLRGPIYIYLYTHTSRISNDLVSKLRLIFSQFSSHLSFLVDLYIIKRD